MVLTINHLRSREVLFFQNRRETTAVNNGHFFIVHNVRNEKLGNGDSEIAIGHFFRGFKGKNGD